VSQLESVCSAAARIRLVISHAGANVSRSSVQLPEVSLMEYLVRLALIIGVAAALLTGCGGSQPPIGAPGPMPQAGRAHARPLTSSGALIYSANSYFGYVTTYTYPHGPRVGEIRAPGAIRAA
jgi:hypothetical protein